MERVRQKIRRAFCRWRWDVWSVAAGWSLFAALWVAVVAVIVSKIWTMPFESHIWCGGWLALSIVWGTLAAGMFLMKRGPTEMAAAMELDRRSQSAERLSTAFILTADERETEMGQVLICDASRRADQLDVAECFPVRRRWVHGLPWIPLMLAIVLASVVRDAIPRESRAVPDVAERQRVEQSIRVLQQSLQPLEERGNGSPIQPPWLRELKRNLQSLTERTDRRTATVRLNQWADELKQRRAARTIWTSGLAIAISDEHRGREDAGVA